MAGATRPVAGGAYSGPRSEPGGQKTPRVGRSISSLGAYSLAAGTFTQQVDQGDIFDDYANVAASAVTASGSGVESYTSYYSPLVQNTPGLVSYWRLSDPSGAAVDEKGVSNGTYNGSVTRDVTGLIPPDTAASFSGVTGSYIGIPSKTAYDTGAQLTVEAWFRPSVLGVRQKVVARSYASIVFVIEVTAQALLNWTVRDTAQADTRVLDLTEVVVGALYHVVGTYDAAGTMKLYINGVASLEVPNRTPNANVRAGTAEDVTIGAVGDFDPFNGTIDEVALYNVALDAATVASHYRVGVDGVSDLPIPYDDAGSGTVTVGGSGSESCVYSDKSIQDAFVASGTGATTSLWGNSKLNGYTADVNLVAVTLGTRFRVSTDKHLAIGVRVWPAANNITGCWAFLLDSSGVILARKAFPGALISGQWNNLLFDARYVIPVDAAGLVAAVFMPTGGYAAKAHELDGSDQGSGIDLHLYALGGNSAPNGVFDYQAITPSSFGGPFVLSGLNNTHYGIDVLVFDQTAASIDARDYTDAGSGTATASGSGVESYSSTDARTATVTASGIGIESYSSAYIDATSGIVTVSGFGVEGVVYTDTSSGTVTASSLRRGVHWSEDFEDGDLADWGSPAELVSTFTATNEAGVGHGGGRGLHLVTNATGVGLEPYIDSSWAYTDTLLRFWLYVNAAPHGGASTVLQARDDFANSVWQLIYFAPNGGGSSRFELFIAGVTTLEGISNSVPEDQWVYVELHLKAEVLGRASLTVDGVVNDSYSGDLSRYNPIAQVQFWAETGNVDLVFDDVQFVHDPDATSESLAATDARTVTITMSGTGSESYVPSGDTTAPIPTVTVVDVTKISRVVGKDAVSVTFTTDEAFVEYEIRRVSSGSDPRGAGNQVETAVVSSRTSHLAVITDDELVSAAASEGSNTLKIFVKDLAGNWST